MTEFMTNDKPLVLVDGSSYLFRAFHALPSLTTIDGYPTGAIRGVIAMLRRLAKDYASSPIAVVFDAKGTTFRNQLYPQYKGNRPSMPDDLRAQIAPIHEIVNAMGLPLLIIEGVEADDVIGTLAREATQKKRDVVISASDKDLAQLVSEHVTLVDTMTDVRLDRAGVIAKFGVPPELIVDYLALMGDTSDNIPGVPKVGPKTAAKWLLEYGNLDGVIAHAADVPGKVGENLRASLSILPLSRQLTTIKCDVALDVGIDALTPSAIDTARLRALFERYEFLPWRDELTDTAAEAVQNATAVKQYETVTNWPDFDAWIERIRSRGQFAFDLETTSSDYMQAELVGIALAIEAGHAAYVPVGHDYPDAPTQLPRDDVIARLKPLFEERALNKIAQNPKYDMNVLANYAVTLDGVGFDTMLESYVLDSVATRHDLDDIAQRYLQLKTMVFEDVAGKGAKQLKFNDVPVERATEYAAEDADVTLRLHDVLWPMLSALPRLRSVFEDIEMPLVGVLSRMERAGALVDGAQLRKQSDELAHRIAELAGEAFSLAGETFNLDSTKQLQAILYDKLGLPVLKKTPGGQPSTAEPVLAELALDYPLPRVIMDYRGLTKLKSTYTDKLPLQINARTGRIHTSYH
ncbi:MAG TPA: DNA polymerase, partial [Pseudomonadales bacterium]